MSSLEEPMGNVELRLTLQRIEELANETFKQAKKTNGRVNLHDRMLWLAMGAIPLLTVWAGWLTIQQLNQPPTLSSQELQEAVNQAFTNNLAKQQ